MLLYLQACNALLAVGEARDSAIVDATRNCPAGTFESAAVRIALFKVISRSTYEQLSLEANHSDDNADAVLSFPEHAIDSSKTV
jgi:hypothetical protein